MSKATTLLILAILLYSTLSYAARPIPAAFLEATTTPSSPQHEGVGINHHVDVAEEKCKEGVVEEECLIRRTLVAHLDYIYTQSKNP